MAGLCIPESYWCSPINPGGKELACGYDYAGPGVKNIVVLLQLVGLALLLQLLGMLINENYQLGGSLGWLYQSILIGLMVLIKLRYGFNDAP